MIQPRVPVAAWLALLFVAVGQPSDAGAIDADRVIAGWMKNEQDRHANVLEYTRLQHYRAGSSRFGANADMVVRMHYRSGHGKDFEILSRSGSAVIQSRIFEKLLEAEVAASRNIAREGSLLNTAHYSFAWVGEATLGGRVCYIFRLTPRLKAQNILDGKVWIDSRDYVLLHLEGRPSASLSFWIGKPVISEDFQNIGGYWFALRRRSVEDGMLLGHSELTVDYSDYHVVERCPASARNSAPISSSAICADRDSAPHSTKP